MKRIMDVLDLLLEADLLASDLDPSILSLNLRRRIEDCIASADRYRIYRKEVLDLNTPRSEIDDLSKEIVWFPSRST